MCIYLCIVYRISVVIMIFYTSRLKQSTQQSQGHQPEFFPRLESLGKSLSRRVLLHNVLRWMYPVQYGGNERGNEFLDFTTRHAVSVVSVIFT